jgi:hypothetical protein
MNMDKKYAVLLVIFFAAMIAVSGCTSNTKTKQITTQAAFLGGTDGLKVSLLPGQPPSQLYSEQQFQIAVQVENKGEGDLVAVNPTPQGPGPGPIPGLAYGYISLAGIDVNSFQTNQTLQLTEQLTPAKKIGTTPIPGGQTQIIFSAVAPNIFAQLQYPLSISALYAYTSKAVAAACVKQNVYQQIISGKEICKITETKTVETSGAPVKVTSVDELPTGFSIKIKNVGGGYAFRYSVGEFPQTESGINPFSDKDRVMIGSVMLGSTELKAGCSPQELYLPDGDAQFFCKANLTAEAEAVEQLVIDLNYGYVSTTSTTFTVTQKQG